MNGVVYIRGENNKTYGNFNDSDQTQNWYLSVSEPIVGIYGVESQQGIDKLGFITLNMQCQSDLNRGEDEE